jgi:hypothetical protein
MYLKEVVRFIAEVFPDLKSAVKAGGSLSKQAITVKRETVLGVGL